MEGGGLGMTWRDAIRMNPAQVVFLLSSEEQAKADARRRNMAFSGKTASDLREENQRRMADLRKRFAGVESKDEV